MYCTCMSLETDSYLHLLFESEGGNTLPKVNHAQREITDSSPEHNQDVLVAQSAKKITRHINRLLRLSQAECNGLAAKFCSRGTDVKSAISKAVSLVTMADDVEVDPVRDILAEETLLKELIKLEQDIRAARDENRTNPAATEVVTLEQRVAEFRNLDRAA